MFVFFFADTSEYKGIDTAELDEVAKTRIWPPCQCLEGQLPIGDRSRDLMVVRIRFALQI